MKCATGKRFILSILVFALLPLVSGCDDCVDDDCCQGWHSDHEPPATPVGVRSITGDGRVTLTWLDTHDEDLDGYRVYVSNFSEGPYDVLGETDRLSFIDYGVKNSRTYFYAVAAFDFCGNESALSYEDVFDTPRPEGRNLVLQSALTRPSVSGYDFSEFRVQGLNDSGTDIYFLGGRNSQACIHAASPLTWIQDVGYMPLVDLDWAPGGGWAASGQVELTVGHTYAVLTADGHYAKFRVSSLSPDRVVMEWAVQLDRGNRELSVQPPASAGPAVPPLPPPPDSGSARQGI